MPPTAPAKKSRRREVRQCGRCGVSESMDAPFPSTTVAACRRHFWPWLWTWSEIHQAWDKFCVKLSHDEGLAEEYDRTVERFTHPESRDFTIAEVASKRQTGWTLISNFACLTEVQMADLLPDGVSAADLNLHPSTLKLSKDGTKIVGYLVQSPHRPYQEIQRFEAIYNEVADTNMRSDQMLMPDQATKVARRTLKAMQDKLPVLIPRLQAGSDDGHDQEDG